MLVIQYGKWSQKWEASPRFDEQIQEKIDLGWKGLSIFFMDCYELINKNSLCLRIFSSLIIIWKLTLRGWDFESSISWHAMTDEENILSSSVSINTTSPYCTRDQIQGSNTTRQLLWQYEWGRDRWKQSQNGSFFVQNSILKRLYYKPLLLCRVASICFNSFSHFLWISFNLEIWH